MKKNEFIKQKKQFEKQFEQNDIFYALVLVLVLFLNWFLVSNVDLVIGPWLLVYLALFAAVVLCCIRWIKKRQQRERMGSGLRCCACSGLLINGLADIALVTEHCPKCGQAVFDKESLPEKGD